MCTQCRDGIINRRTVIAALGSTLVASIVGARQSLAHDPTSISPDQALTKLIEGNKKFVKSPELCVADLARRRDDTASSQAPWATIVSCSDSRVPPELIFGGQGPGDLFVARNAGNMVDVATMGTIEYGAAVLGVPLIVVLGHQSCGAVAAACDVVTEAAEFPGSIGPMVDAIVPAARAVQGEPGDFVENAIRESARRTTRQIANESPLVGDLISADKVKVMAARYGLESGEVEFL